MKRIKSAIATIIAITMLLCGFPLVAKAAHVVLPPTPGAALPNGTYYLVNAEFSKIAQIDNNQSSSTNGAILELWELDGNEDQQWEINFLSNGYYKITSAASNKAITAPSSVDDSLQQKTYTEASTQQWKITWVGNGKYKLFPRSNTSYYMAAGDGAFTSDGRNIEMREARGDNKDKWYLINASGSGADAMLLGITDNGHDHASAFGYITPDLVDLGYEDIYCSITDSKSMTTVRNMMANAKIYVSRSHGDYDSDGSNIELSSNGASKLHTTDVYDFSTNTAKVDLSDCDLMLFVACYTGFNENISLPHAVVAAGAQAAVGFKDSIGCSTANDWTEYFFDYYTQDYSVSLSAYYAARDCNNSNGIDSYRVVS